MPSEKQHQRQKLLRGAPPLAPARGFPRLPRFACAALRFAPPFPLPLRFVPRVGDPPPLALATSCSFCSSAGFLRTQMQRGISLALIPNRRRISAGVKRGERGTSWKNPSNLGAQTKRLASQASLDSFPGNTAAKSEVRPNPPKVFQNTGQI